MLQRRQTIWTLLAAVFAALTFKFSFFSGNVQVGTNGHVFRGLTAVPVFIDGGCGSVLILIVTILIIVGALYNIFNYKARTKQLWITIGLIVLSLLNIFLYWQASLTPQHFMEGHYDLTAVFTLIIPVLLIFAARGIMRDQRLVKSADRLR
jgi:hypothetical protein